MRNTDAERSESADDWVWGSVTQRDRRRRLDGLGGRVPEIVVDRDLSSRAEELVARAAEYLAEERRRWHTLYLAVVTDPDDRERLAALLRAREGDECAPPWEGTDSACGRRWLERVLGPGNEAPDGTE
jgi:hypothetical protein